MIKYFNKIQPHVRLEYKNVFSLISLRKKMVFFDRRNTKYKIGKNKYTIIS